MPMTFDAFFQAATGNATYDYQRRLASGIFLKSQILHPRCETRFLRARLA